MICNFDLFLIGLLIIVIIFLYDQVKSIIYNKNEGFQSTTTSYQADIEAIRNLSSIATQLNSSNSLTMPGVLNVNTLNTKGTLKIGSWTLMDRNGHLQFIKDGTAYNDDYSKIPQDTGFIAMGQDGNIWSNRSTGRGWLADNKLNVSGGTINGDLIMNGKIAMNDNRIILRGINDPNHYIKWNGETDGPEISACGGINITRQCPPNNYTYPNPYIKLGEWQISATNDQASLRFDRPGKSGRYYLLVGNWAQYGYWGS